MKFFFFFVQGVIQTATHGHHLLNALCEQCRQWQHEQHHQQQQSQKTTMLMTMPMIDDSDNDEMNHHDVQILNDELKLSKINHQSHSTFDDNDDEQMMIQQHSTTMNNNNNNNDDNETKTKTRSPSSSTSQTTVKVSN